MCETMVWLHSVMVTISSSGFKWAWKSLVFLVFPAVFARLFVTQQRRRNGRRLVHKVMNNGFEILDKVNFSFDLRVNFRSILRAILSSSLGNIARKNFFRVLKKSSGHSWDILAFSCEMWRSAAHLVEGTPDFLRSNSLKQNDRLLRGEQHEGRGYMAYILDGIKRYFYGLNHLSTDNI